MLNFRNNFSASVRRQSRLTAGRAASGGRYCEQGRRASLSSNTRKNEMLVAFMRRNGYRYK